MVTSYHSTVYCCRKNPSERIIPEEDYQTLIDLEYEGDGHIPKFTLVQDAGLGDG